MEAFSAVVTTGIYCRPGCGARPHAENVRKFPLAASAESAGYRACLRCRPYRAAPLVPWSAPELVCRAVQLILDGALDTGTEADLGSRIGISARHLRRLFAAHVGVTPDGLARSARAHFARRLLDDTDLTITQVAYAAGFGSLRQFNRACHEIFRASPRELRARRRVPDRLVADGGLALRLPYTGALDWEGMLGYLAERAMPGVEHVSEATYRRTIMIDGDPGVLEVSRGGEEYLLLVAHLPHWEELIHIVARARHIANLDVDQFWRRLPGTWDPFETGVHTILGQGTDAETASKIAARLVARVGNPVPGLRAFGLTHTFPPPEVVAAAEPNRLGLSSAQTKTVQAFAAAVVNETVRIDHSASLDVLTASLREIDGIEIQTVHELALRLGERDAFRIKPTPARTAA